MEGEALTSDESELLGGAVKGGAGPPLPERERTAFMGQPVSLRSSRRSGGKRALRSGPMVCYLHRNGEIVVPGEGAMLKTNPAQVPDFAKFLDDVTVKLGLMSYCKKLFRPDGRKSHRSRRYDRRRIMSRLGRPSSSRRALFRSTRALAGTTRVQAAGHSVPRRSEAAEAGAGMVLLPVARPHQLVRGRHDHLGARTCARRVGVLLLRRLSSGQAVLGEAAQRRQRLLRRLRRLLLLLLGHRGKQAQEPI